MEYKKRLLMEYRDLVEKRVLLEHSNHLPDDKLLQEQLEAMFRYEEILFERILRIMEESDPKEAVATEFRR